MPFTYFCNCATFFVLLLVNRWRATRSFWRNFVRKNIMAPAARSSGSVNRFNFSVSCFTRCRNVSDWLCLFIVDLHYYLCIFLVYIYMKAIKRWRYGHNFNNPQPKFTRAGVGLSRVQDQNILYETRILNRL